MRRAVLLATATAIVAVLAVGIASADPVNSKNAEIIPITCDNGQSYRVVVTSGNPAHIVGSTGNFIPVQFTFTAIDPDTGEVLFEETDTVGKGKKRGLKEDLITCKAGPFTEFDPEIGQEVTFTITVKGFLTPRRG